MPTESITLTIDGEEGRLPPGAFIKALRALLDTLDEVRQSFGENDGFSGWSITQLAKTNPGIVTLESEIHHDVVEYAIEGIAQMNQSAIRPQHFSMRALTSAKNLVSVLNNGIRELTVRNGQLSVSPTQHLAANVDEIVGSKYYFAPTTVEGRMNVIDVRGRLKISVHDEAYNRDIVCRCDSELLDVARDLLNHRVAVYGEVKYRRSDDVPLSIEAEDIFSLSDKVVGFGDLPRLSITGDLSSEDYVRRMRDGT